MIDLRDFGVAGDGMTDDTAALEAAINAADFHIDSLLIPSGEYRFTRPLVVNPRRMTLFGDGPQLSILIPELEPGQYAITFSWPNSDTSAGRGPYDAMQGVSVHNGGNNASHGIRVSGEQASHLTFRDVSLRGFSIQVELGDNCFCCSFERVSFHQPALCGVRMNDPASAGENISFSDCIWSGGTGTGVYLNKTGASFYFTRCSFDYLARAIRQRAGKVSVVSSHFEAGPEYNGEFILIDRNGSVSLPMMTLTDCDFYTLPSSYDCLIRLAGQNGDNGLRLTNPYIGVADPMPYLIRDDGLNWHSNVIVSGAWYTRSDTPPPKMRLRDGTEVSIYPNTYQVISA